MDRNRGFDINALRQQMEELLEDFLPTGGPRRPAGGRPAGDQTQTLAVNLVDAEGAFTLTAPLPGMQPEDIDVSVRGQSVSIRAQRKNQPAERPNFVRREWGFASYQRGLELPGPVDAEGATASYRLGVITVTLPKADPNRAQVIPVDDADEAAERADALETEPAEPHAEMAADLAEAEAVETPLAVTEEASAEPPAETVPEPSAEQPAEPAAEAPAAPPRGGFYMQQRGRNRGARGNRNAKARAANAPAAEAAPATEAASEGREAQPAPAVVDVPVQGEFHAPEPAASHPEPAQPAPAVESTSAATTSPEAASAGEQAPTD